MSETIKHNVELKLEETHKKTDEGCLVGYGVSVCYEGPNKYGIDKKMAISCIGALLSSAGVDREDIEKITDKLSEELLSEESAKTAVADSFEEAETVVKNKKKKDAVESANETFIRMINDPKWGKVINNKTDFSVKEMSGLKVLAWVATALRVVGDMDKEKQSRLEKLFLKDIAGLNDDE